MREKVSKYDWAKEAQADYVSKAGKWNVPGVRNPTNPAKEDWLFVTAVEGDLMAAGISYQLTLDKKYAEYQGVPTMRPQVELFESSIRARPKSDRNSRPLPSNSRLAGLTSR